jgi:hypothetical protein
MKRSAIVRPAAVPKTRKRRKPKPRSGHDQAARNICKGQQCYLRLPGVCLGAAGAATVVPAHSNQGAHGKGERIKAHDRYTVPACHSCHAEIDSGNRLSRAQKFHAWDMAYAAWEPVRALELAAQGRALKELPTSKVVPRAFLTSQPPLSEAAA